MWQEIPLEQYRIGIDVISASAEDDFTIKYYKEVQE